MEKPRFKKKKKFSFLAFYVLTYKMPDTKLRPTSTMKRKDKKSPVSKDSAM